MCVIANQSTKRVKRYLIIVLRKLKSYKKKIIDMQFSDLKIPEEIAKNTVGDL